MKENKEELISLAEYAAIHNIDSATVRQRVLRGSYQTARKIGRNWVIDKNEPHLDHRIKKEKYKKISISFFEKEREGDGIRGGIIPFLVP